MEITLIEQFKLPFEITIGRTNRGLVTQEVRWKEDGQLEFQGSEAEINAFLMGYILGSGDE